MLYNFARMICRLVLVIMRRWEVRGAGNMPATGGVVLVANHLSYWDPIVVGGAVNRQVHFMAKFELFKIPVLGPFISLMGSFPVRRDRPDRNAIRTAVKLLQEGKVVGVFPEGTRNSSGELMKPHLGAAMLANRAGVPILPVAVSGSRGVFGKVKVHVGEPFLCQGDTKASKADLEKASDQAMEQIASMLARL